MGSASCPCDPAPEQVEALPPSRAQCSGGRPSGRWRVSWRRGPGAVRILPTSTESPQPPKLHPKSRHTSACKTKLHTVPHLPSCCRGEHRLSHERAAHVAVATHVGPSSTRDLLPGSTSRPSKLAFRSSAAGLGRASEDAAVAPLSQEIAGGEPRQLSQQHAA